MVCRSQSSPASITSCGIHLVFRYLLEAVSISSCCIRRFVLHLAQDSSTTRQVRQGVKRLVSLLLLLSLLISAFAACVSFSKGDDEAPGSLSGAVHHGDWWLLELILISIKRRSAKGRSAHVEQRGD